MKRKIVYLWPLFAIPLFAVWVVSCNKSRQTAPIGADVTMITAARQYLEGEMYLSDSIDSSAFGRRPFRKVPLWDQAVVDTFSFGRGVVVPLQVVDTLSIVVGESQLWLPVQGLTWVLMYKDIFDRWQVEVITRIPHSVASASFTGEIRVENWSGRFLRAYYYGGGSAVLLTTSRIFNGGPSGSPSSPSSPSVVSPPAGSFSPPSASPPARGGVTPLLEAPKSPGTEVCTETDWYACSSIGDGPTECTYVYTTEDCTGPGASTPTTPAPGSPVPGDYLIAGGGTGSSSNPSLVQSIIPDTSITQHPIIACVFNHLMSPSLAYGLKSILSSFSDNEVYNVTFSVAPNLGVDGKTIYQGNNNFQIILNGDEADDTDYSRIYLASTFIHEAFHAKLRQKALETFGEAPISQWPTSIDDMTLAQLATYFESESKSNNIWQSVEHDWMVENISQLATALQDFVRAYYKTTYASVGDSLAPYEALMYMGLEGSVFYQEEVVEKGLDSNFKIYWQELNEGGKCQD